MSVMKRIEIRRVCFSSLGVVGEWCPFCLQVPAVIEAVTRMSQISFSNQKILTEESETSDPIP